MDAVSAQQLQDLIDVLSGVRVIDLGHEMRRGMPVSPNHPPFQMALQRRHGDDIRSEGYSSANELIVTGGHVGTHIDALAHVSRHGRMFGDASAEELQTNDGFTQLGIDEFEPMVGRGVLLDIAGLHGVDVLEPGYEVTVDDLEAAEEAAGVSVQEGDAVLIRTGWSQHWGDPIFIGAQGAPGPSSDGAQWLAQRKIRVAGGESITFEMIKAETGHSLLPAHLILMADHGINIMEVMDLRALAETGATTFGCILSPLKLRGATGSPVRPLALLPGAG